MTKDEALKLALEALHGFIPYLPLNDEAQCGRYDKALTAIKEALAQPESEYERGFIDGMQKQMQSSVDKAVNAMTQPTYYIPNKDDRLWVGLTDEDKNEILLDAVRHGWNDRLIVEQIEAKLKEKNK